MAWRIVGGLAWAASRRGVLGPDSTLQKCLAPRCAEQQGGDGGVCIHSARASVGAACCVKTQCAEGPANRSERVHGPMTLRQPVPPRNEHLRRCSPKHFLASLWSENLPWWFFSCLSLNTVGRTLQVTRTCRGEERSQVSVMISIPSAAVERTQLPRRAHSDMQEAIFSVP